MGREVVHRVASDHLTSRTAQKGVSSQTGARAHRKVSQIACFQMSVNAISQFPFGCRCECIEHE